LISCTPPVMSKDVLLILSRSHILEMSGLEAFLNIGEGAYRLINLLSVFAELNYGGASRPGHNFAKIKRLTVQIAEKLGLGAESLLSQELEDAVLASDRYAKQDLNIHGVPYFTVGSGERRAVLRGAQSVEAIEHVLVKQISKLLVRQEQ